MCESRTGDRVQHSGYLRGIFTGKGHGGDFSDAGNVYLTDGSTGAFMGKNERSIILIYNFVCEFCINFSFICKNEWSLILLCNCECKLYPNDKVNRNEDMF